MTAETEQVQHTSGPWENEWIGTCRRIVDANGFSWNPLHVPHDCTIAECPGRENKRKLDTFNDLLVALERLLRDSSTDGGVDVEDHLEARGKAYAAIRKARGGE